MSEKVNLGPITAYAIAVKNGYVGTEQEWLNEITSNGNEIRWIKERLTSPFNFLGDKNTISDLPSSGNAQNDTWYVISEKRRYSWTGSAWEPSSMNESDYADELSEIEASLKEEIDILDRIHQNEHGYIPYDYDIPAHTAETPGATDSKVFGVDRMNQMVKVTNSTALSNRDAGVRLTGPVVRLVLGTTGANNTIDAWTTGVRLEAGHTYQIRKYLVSGLENGATSVSVYKQGEHLTAGSGNTTRVGNLYTRTFVAEDAFYNIILYINKGTILTDANYIIQLIDLSKNAEAIPAIAKVFDETVEYKAGEYVWANNEIYQFVKPHPAGAWSDEDAKKIIVGDDLRNVMRQANLTYGVAQPPIALSSIVEHQGINTSGVRSLNRSDRARTNRFRNLPEGMVLRVGDTPLWAVGYEDKPREDNENYDDYLTRTFNGTLSGLLVNTEYFLDPEHYPIIILVGQCETAEQMQAAISLFANTAAIDHVKIEDYYLDEMEDTVAKVRDLCDEPSLVFPWATDIHRWSDNAGGVQSFENMIRNMTIFSKNVKCDFVLFTGDLTDGDVAKNTTIDRAYDCLDKFRSIGVPFVWSQGNHDNNPYNGNSNIFTLQDCFKAYFSSTKGYVNMSENGTDYYVDFDELGTRLIVLNANNVTDYSKYAYGNSTADWLNSVLDVNKNILLAIHQTPFKNHTYDSTTTTQKSSSIITVINTFIANGGNIIVLSGHSHLDIAFVDPWIEIMQDCQRFTPDMLEDQIDNEHSPSASYIDVCRRNAREANTASEDLWTACVYQPFSNDLFLVRFGAGRDRYFHVNPIEPRTLTTRLTGNVVWISSDQSVATVEDGVVTGVSTGKCAVLANDETGNYECWIVTVNE